MMLIFSIFSPIGIIIGMILLDSAFVEGILLAISAGTFLYISASEVIVEEFSITKYKYEKFILFLSGSLFAFALLYIE
jgi:zinc transporter 1/2/3